MSDQTSNETTNPSTSTADRYNEHALPTSEKQAKGEALRLGWREWIVERFQWSWFTCTQSTGGIAIVLSECPKQFKGLQTIGTIVFIFNLVLFLTFCSLLVMRWVFKPSTFRKSLIVAPECYFYGSFWLTMATIIIGMQRFAVPHAGPWIVVAIRVCFWTYAAITLLSTTLHFVVIFQHTEIKSIEMNPAWLFLVYNVMLTGTVAAAIAMDQPPEQRLPILVAGVGFQGLGWILALLLLAWLVGHLMEKGWPEPSKAPGLFMTVGSSGYTIVALIGCAMAAPDGYGFFAQHPTGKEVLVIVATWVGIFMWVFTLWLFGIALFVCLAEMVKKRDNRWYFPMSFNNTWWAFIFPNVGFTLATIYIGQSLQSNAIEWVSAVMVILVVLAWILDLIWMAKVILLSLFKDSRYKLA